MDISLNEVGYAMAAMLVIAGLAWWAERRRGRRTDADAVGIMPWRDVAFWASVALVLLGAWAFRLWLRGD